MTDPPLKRSFPPIIDAASRALVLGTLPGEASLRRAQYYAHPRNLFWPILFALFDEPLQRDYAERVRRLADWRIALWDVVAAGQRQASADATIRDEQPNPIDALLDAHPAIRVVAFNGSGARRLFDRHVGRRAGLGFLALPSTSPAHARLDFARKLAAWAPLREALLAPAPAGQTDGTAGQPLV